MAEKLVVYTVVHQPRRLKLPAQVIPLARLQPFYDAMDAPNEGDWGVMLSASDFRTVRDAGFEAVWDDPEFQKIREKLAHVHKEKKAE